MSGAWRSLLTVRPSSTVQLAINTTMVSHLQRNGMARRRAAHHNGAALEDALPAPNLVGERGRARLVISGCRSWWEVVRRKPQMHFRKPKQSQFQRMSGKKCAGRGFGDGAIF